MINKAERAKEFAFTRSDFTAICSRLKAMAGIHLSDSKDSMVYSRLSRRIRALELKSFKQYLHYLDNHTEEKEAFVNALTTNLTSFFREEHHFDILKQYVRENPQPLTVWCTACSSGEEAYSIAMACAEARGDMNNNITLLASDIDSGVLETAQRGIYARKAIENLSLSRKRQFFLKGKGARSGLVRVSPQLQQSITFFQQNLLATSWQVNAPLDAIFCRNVMIYFDRTTQAQLVEKFCHVLKPGGLYFAGHSENFSHLNHWLKPRGKTVYETIRRSTNA
ncbi:CheR family methyltransferase [Alteromonas sp. ASW11-36]|uniref:Chemotaxis protein methyltransferase n=1 Tax=Alteromonas arenosi TaxID=3055817 RepID=A0ABT7T197_9ALTE|nr:CheR family methyltransferase [Alteromonas sp. ASW11-36]MDM7862186.1 CheR family methyltransferase [Alteromonas sp. ASW11-36]